MGVKQSGLKKKQNELICTTKVAFETEKLETTKGKA